MPRFLASATLCGLMLAATAPHAQTASGAAASTSGPTAADGTGALPTASDEVLVRVDLTEIAEQLATHLRVGRDVLPRSVEMPIGNAADLCGLKEAQLLLVRMVEANVECKAAAISEDLSEATRAQMARDKEAGTDN